MITSEYQFGASGVGGSYYAYEGWSSGSMKAVGYTGYQWTGPQTANSQPTTALLVVGDSVAGDTSTTATLTVGAGRVVGTLETLGDQDFYKVQLTAGQIYEIGMFMKVGGPSGVPVADSYIEIYDQNGNLLTQEDGGVDAAGLDALMVFAAEYTGTYYINARGYEQNAANGTTGDQVGDYEVSVSTSTAAGAYTPYYSVDSPLHSIDWGAQLDHSSRNPDGDNGPRDNGSPATGVGWNEYGITGKNVFTYYLAKAGEVYTDEDYTTLGTTDTMVAKGWSTWEHDALKIAFKAYENVADIIYVQVQERNDADFVFITYNGTPGRGTPSVLGRMSPPDEDNEGRGEFNAGDERWTAGGLAPGGFAFTTLIHEMGHGHGMAHPHDDGGRSSIMRGVEPLPVEAGGQTLPVDKPFTYTAGDFGFGQGVFTMMAYQDGWEQAPWGQAASQDPYGWLGGPMAFDIAVLQDKYGVNEEYRTGNDTYELKDVNEAGAFYSAIWDAGGTDTIRYSGARDTNIDLRAASLKYEAGGGGWISWAYGVHGGFTIANGVTIENGLTGSGNDTLTGNGVNNALGSGAGNDVLTGGDGNDDLRGGTGDDRLDGGDGVDTANYYDAQGGVTVDLRLDGSAQVTGGGGTDTLISIEQLIGSSYADTLYAGSGKGWMMGGGGNDWLYGNDGDDALGGGAGSDHLEGGLGTDTAFFQYDATAAVTINLTTGVHTGDAAGDVYSSIETFSLSLFGDRFTGDANGQTVYGHAGSDTLDGAGGSDVLLGGIGDDVLTGGAGADTFVFNTAFGRDRVSDFTQGLDRITLSGIAGVDDFGDLRVTASGVDSIITFGDGSQTITLTGVSALTVTAADFLFA